MTTGEIMFYGGVAGAVIVLIVSVVILIALANGRKRLRHKFDTDVKK